MSFDLFFMPKGANFAKVRAEGFKPTPAQRKAFAGLQTALAQRYADCRFVTNPAGVGGSFDNFPRGHLEGTAGCLQWSLNGELPEKSELQEIVDWFLAQGYDCDDPQDSGFGNRQTAAKARAARAVELGDWNELLQGRIVSFTMAVRDGQALGVVFGMTAGKSCQCEFIGVLDLVVPRDQAKLISGRIAATSIEAAQIFDRYTFTLDNGLEFSFTAAGCSTRVTDEA